MDLNSTQPTIAVEQGKDPMLLQVIISMSPKQKLEQFQSLALDPQFNGFAQHVDAYLMEGGIHCTRKSVDY